MPWGRLEAARLQAAPALPSLLIADADFDRDPSAVSAAGALADLDTALRAFEEAYAGLDGQPRLPAAAAIAAERRKLAARDRWTPAALATELCALFGRPDGHLAFGYGGHAPLRLTAFPTREQPQQAGSPGDSSAAMLGVRLELREDAPRFATKATHHLELHEDAPCSAPDRSLFTPARLEPLAAGAEAVRFADGRVPVVSIRTFDSAAKAALVELPAIAGRLRRKSGFVVDLRGNRGGNYSFAEAFVLALTDRTLQRLDEREVRSVAAAEGRANSARRRIAAGDVPVEARRAFDEHIESLETEARALRAEGAPRTEIVTRGATVRGHAPGPLSARAVFLVDQGCASACEMMVALARQIPGVILAGDNTHGGMAVGEVALFRLPFSGVTISLGTRAFHDPLGAFAETRGFVPDVRLPGLDPLASARDLAATFTGGTLALADGARHR